MEKNITVGKAIGTFLLKLKIPWETSKYGLPLRYK